MLSVGVLLASALLVPFVVTRIPADYFMRAPAERSRHPALTALRFTLGSLLIVAGLAMLVLPGQGVLTILAGVSLLPFRGKRKLELWLLRRGPIRRMTQALRSRAGQPPLVLEVLPDAPEGRER